MAVKTTADNFQKEVLESGIPVLVDFYSDSCVPCKRMSPILAEIEEESHGRLKLCKVNVNGELALAQSYRILSAPTLLLFVGGAEHKRETGFIGKTALHGIINQVLEGLK